MRTLTSTQSIDRRAFAHRLGDSGVGREINPGSKPSLARRPDRVPTSSTPLRGVETAPHRILKNRRHGAPRTSSLSLHLAVELVIDSDSRAHAGILASLKRVKMLT